MPDTLDGIGFMEKDGERFPDTGGWGYAQFSYDPASDTFTPDERYVGDAKCGSEFPPVALRRDPGPGHDVVRFAHSGSGDAARCCGSKRALS